MDCTEPAHDAVVGTPPPSPPCPLEALNTDCLMAILLAGNSLADLGSFIRASPTVLRCFVSAKSLILRHVMTNELGPAIRDARVMSLTNNINMFAAGTFQQTFDNAICAWRESLLTDRPPWVVPPLDDDTAADMARLTRLVLYFVDLYISLRLRHFREALDPPYAGEWGVSQTERRRIAQALMRTQVLVSLHHPSFDHPDGADEFFTLAIGLFESWELEQMSTMAHFVCDLVIAWRRLDKHAHLPEPLPPGNRYHSQQYFSLPALYARLAQNQLTNGGTLHSELLRVLSLYAGKMTGAGSGVRWLRSSHRWVWVRAGDAPAAVTALLEEDQPSLPEEQEKAGGAAPAVVFDGDDSPTSPPWGWIQAWNGQRVRRWGLDLVPERPPAGGDWDEHERVIDLVYRWRWLGLEFWDRDRAEALLNTKVLERCRRPGWLASYTVSGRIESTTALEQASGGT